MSNRNSLPALSAFTTFDFRAYFKDKILSYQGVDPWLQYRAKDDDTPAQVLGAKVHAMVQVDKTKYPPKADGTPSTADATGQLLDICVEGASPERIDKAYKLGMSVIDIDFAEVTKAKPYAVGKSSFQDRLSLVVAAMPSKPARTIADI